MKADVENLQKEMEGFSAEKIVAFALKRFGKRVTLATSLGAEDQVLTHMISQITKDANIFTLDTGRLHQETYDILEKTRETYGINKRIVFPDAKKVEKMVNLHGPNLFYESVANRKLCCGIRKVEPLKKELSRMDAWITGLRQEQQVTRVDLKPLDWNEGNGLIKLCPLYNWTNDQVWDYLKKNQVPYNQLHDQGFPSIGCAPCTRAIQPGEDIRAGRWWWEEPEHKECGLHERRKNKK